MCVQGVDSGTAESCVPLQCVNDSQSMVDVWDTSEVVDTYPPDGLLVDTARIWEAEVSPTLNQISDVQGRLKQKIQFWQEILHAPPSHPGLYREWLPLAIKVCSLSLFST